MGRRKVITLAIMHLVSKSIKKQFRVTLRYFSHFITSFNYIIKT
jgi:hypothetical protein